MADLIIADKRVIEGIFDGAAAEYDRTGPPIFARFGARLVELADIRPGATVLDVATGAGAVLLPAGRAAGPSGHVTGVDLSAGILAEAARAAAAAGLTTVSLRKMDAEQLAFADASFDAVTCGFGLFFFPQADAALAEMVRVCRPHGVIGLTLFSRMPPPFDPGWPLFAQHVMAHGSGYRLPQRVAHTPDEAAALLAGAGLTDVTVHAETYDVVWPNEDAWWNFQLTLGSRATILAMDEATRERFRASYLAALRPYFRPEGLHLAVGVLYVMGRKAR